MAPDHGPGIEPGGAVAAQHAELAVGGEVGGQGDETERGEHDPDVADDVVLAGDHATEVGVGIRAEHAGEDEHGHGGKGDQADEHAWLAQQQAQLDGGEADDRAQQAVLTTAGVGGVVER